MGEKMRNVIITGGSGFIGRWLTKEMIENGVNVTLIVRDRAKVSDEIKNSKMVKIVEGLIEALEASDFRGDQYDCFYHLAWDGVASDKKNNVDVQLANIKLAISAMELANELKCKRFIAAGTVAEYVFSKDIMNFTEKQTPNDMYGAAKTSTHYFLDVRARQLDQEFNWVIIPSTFGEYREDNNIITYTIRTLLRGDKPLYGELTQMWDFLYVAEVAKALRLVGEKGKSGTIYGIGSGVFKPLKNYVLEIRDLINPELPLGIGEKKGMDVKTFSSCVNTIDLIRDTGFVPTVSFSEGIRRTIDYWSRLN